MTAWWIAVVAYLVVILPTLAVLLHKALRPALAMKRVADEIADRGAKLVSQLDALDEMERSPDLVEEVGVGLVRYGKALEELR